MKKENKCTFQIPIYLLPGKHWRIVFQLESLKYHNHIRLNLGEMSISTKRLSERDQQMCSIATKQAGSGAAAGMIAEMTGKTISQNQARRSRERLDNDLKNVDKKTSQANQVIQFLRCNPNRFRFQALYHEVDDASLLLLKKARLRRFCVQNLIDEKKQ